MQAVKSILCNVSFERKNHKSITCNTITEQKTKRTMLRRSGRCFFFFCLKAEHITPGCHSKAKCFNCEGRHHVAICENPKKPVQPSESEADVASPSRFEFFPGEIQRCWDINNARWQQLQFCATADSRIIRKLECMRKSYLTLVTIDLIYPARCLSS